VPLFKNVGINVKTKAFIFGAGKNYSRYNSSMVFLASCRPGEKFEITQKKISPKNDKRIVATSRI
jgi:hypothetical protein